MNEENAFFRNYNIGYKLDKNLLNFDRELSDLLNKYNLLTKNAIHLETESFTSLTEYNDVEFNKFLKSINVKNEELL